MRRLIYKTTHILRKLFKRFVRILYKSLSFLCAIFFSSSTNSSCIYLCVSEMPAQFAVKNRLITLYSIEKEIKKFSLKAK